jgi:hypothetical protein
VYSVNVSPDGKWLTAAGQLWHLPAGKPSEVLADGEATSELIFSRDSKRLVSWVSTETGPGVPPLGWEYDGDRHGVAAICPGLRGKRELGERSRVGIGGRERHR